jgi:O-antigen/teichoic acid export membrane protein
LSGVSTQLSAWFSRTAQFGTISVSRIFASVLTVACSLGFYFVIPGAAGLVVSYTFGTLVTCGYLMFRFAQFHSITPLSFGEMSMLVGRHRNFPLYTMPTELIGNFAQQLPLFIFTSFSGAQSAGLFSRSRQILGLPITYIGSSVAEVYRQKASDLFRTNPAGLRPLFFKTIGSLTAISVIPFMVGVVYSPQLFAWLFGEPWRQAGVFTQYLAIMYFFKFVISPVTFNFMLAGRQREDLVLHVLILLTTSLALFLGLKLKSEGAGLILYAFVYSFMYIVYGARSFQLSPKALRE